MEYLCNSDIGSIKSKRVSIVDAENQTTSRHKLHKDLSHKTEEMHEIEILKNVEQQILYLTDSMSEGTNRMSAQKIADKPSRTQMSGQKRESVPMDHQRKQTSLELSDSRPQSKEHASNFQMRSRTGDAKPPNDGKELPELNRNSKSVESVDGGSNLHEVLKPKGIEIYSTSQANSDNVTTPHSRVKPATSGLKNDDKMQPKQDVEDTVQTRVEGAVRLET